MKISIQHHLLSHGRAETMTDFLHLQAKGDGSITVTETSNGLDAHIHIKDKKQGEFTATFQKRAHQARKFTVISGSQSVASSYFEKLHSYFDDLIKDWKEDASPNTSYFEGTTHTTPMPFPQKTFTLHDFEACPVGNKTLSLIETLIAKKILKHTSKDEYLKEFLTNELPQGLCWGQASALMLCNQNMKPGDEKTVVEKAKELHSVAFQILDSLDYTLGMNQYVSANLKKNLKKRDSLDKKIEKIVKKSTPNKKEKKELKKLSEKTDKISFKIKQSEKKFIQKVDPSKESIPVGFGPRCYLDSQTTTTQQKKIKELDHKLLKELGNLTFKEKLFFKINEKEKILSVIETYAKKQAEYQIRMAFDIHGGTGHVILISKGEKLSIYDQNIGLFTTKDFASFKDKFLKIASSDNYDYCTFEIFKRQPKITK